MPNYTRSHIAHCGLYFVFTWRGGNVKECIGLAAIETIPHWSACEIWQAEGLHCVTMLELGENLCNKINKKAA